MKIMPHISPAPGRTCTDVPFFLFFLNESPNENTHLSSPLASGSVDCGLTTSETDTTSTLASGTEHGGVSVVNPDSVTNDTQKTEAQLS